jgi:hypothetical protein
MNERPAEQSQVGVVETALPFSPPPTDKLLSRIAILLFILLQSSRSVTRHLGFATNSAFCRQLWSKDRALSMLAHDRWRLPAHAPIGLHHRPGAGPTPSARAESDRVACLCPSATVHICNPRMSRGACPDVVSASRRSSLEPANAQRHPVPLCPCTSGCAFQKEQPSSLFRLPSARVIKPPHW